MRILLILIVVSTLCQSIVYACICPEYKSLKDKQEREFENSNSILIISVIKVDREAESFKFTVVEVLKGNRNSSKILTGINPNDCGPSVFRKGKWLVYGNMGMDNILSINACGLTRSFAHPEYNVYAGHKPPPPPPSEQSTMEERNKHQQSLKKWKRDNVAPAKKNLEDEIISLRNKRN